MEIPTHVNLYNQYGVDHRAEARRLRQLLPNERVLEYTQQRESYINHLAQDEAVSILYRYYPADDGYVYTQPSRKEIFNLKYQIDPAERSGLMYDGALSAIRLAQEHPNRLVALYSPTGKKLLNQTPLSSVQPTHLPFLLRPYKEGQLYFLYFDGKDIRNVAISIHGDDNPWLSELSPHFIKLNSISDEEKRITGFLTTPIVLDNIEEFFDRQWNYDEIVYRNVHGHVFYLDEVLKEMRATFAGRKKQYINSLDQTIQAMENHMITEKMVLNGYLTSVLRYMKENNMVYIKFGGGCPGTESTVSEIEQILGLDRVRDTVGLFSSFSSLFRYIRQEPEKKWDYHDGYCVVCDPKEEKTKKKVGPCNICVDCEKGFSSSIISL